MPGDGVEDQLQSARDRPGETGFQPVCGVGAVDPGAKACGQVQRGAGAGQAVGLVGPNVGEKAQAVGDWVKWIQINAAPVKDCWGRRGRQGAGPIRCQGQGRIGGAERSAADAQGVVVPEKVQPGAGAEFGEDERQAEARGQPMGGSNERRGAADLVRLRGRGQPVEKKSRMSADRGKGRVGRAIARGVGGGEGRVTSGQAWRPPARRRGTEAAREDGSPCQARTRSATGSPACNAVARPAINRSISGEPSAAQAEA